LIKKINFKNLNDRKVLMIYKNYKIALFMILSTGASSQVVAMTPEQLAQFQNKYSQSPIARCKNAGCNNTEECFNLHKKLLSAEHASQETIEKNLALDEQVLKNAAVQFWGGALFSAWHPTEYNRAISCLAHLAEQRNYLATNAAIEEQANNLINKTKNLPTDDQSLQARVLSEQHTTNYPFENFRAQCNKDLSIIDSWLYRHSLEFPTLAGKLQATKLVIGR
jgi:hypothetical protein